MKPKDKVYSYDRNVIFEGTPLETTEWLKGNDSKDADDVFIGADHDWMSKKDYLNWRNTQQVKSIIQGIMLRQESATLLGQKIDIEMFAEEMADKIAKLLLDEH